MESSSQPRYRSKSLDDDWEIPSEPAGKITVERQAELEAFMKRIVRTAKKDKSVPDFVQETVAVWLKELEEDPLKDTK
jgi:hypothetical protein